MALLRIDCRELSIEAGWWWEALPPVRDGEGSAQDGVIEMVKSGHFLGLF